MEERARQGSTRTSTRTRNSNSTRSNVVCCRLRSSLLRSSWSEPSLFFFFFSKKKNLFSFLSCFSHFSKVRSVAAAPLASSGKGKEEVSVSSKTAVTTVATTSAPSVSASAAPTAVPKVVAVPAAENSVSSAGEKWVSDLAAASEKVCLFCFFVFVFCLFCFFVVCFPLLTFRLCSKRRSFAIRFSRRLVRF